MPALGLDYRNKVKYVYPHALYGYWPLESRAGSATMEDWSLQANHGTATATNLNHALSAAGRKCPRFDGSTSYVDVYSAGLNTDFGAAVGSAMAWFRVEESGVYSDSTKRRILTIGAHATTNVIILEKTVTANTFRLAYVANSTTDAVSPTIYDPGTYSTKWHQLVLVWDLTTADKVYAYVDGALSSTSSTLGTWSGALLSTACVIGSSSTTAADVWKGWISDVALWSVALSAADVAYLYARA